MIEEIVFGFLFVVSNTILFNQRFTDHKVVKGIAVALAIVSTWYLGKQIYGDIRSWLGSYTSSGVLQAGPGTGVEPDLWKGNLVPAAGYTKYFQVGEIVNLLPRASTPNSWDFMMLKSEQSGRLFLLTSSAKAAIMTEQEPGFAACRQAVFSAVDVYLDVVGNRWLCVDTNDNHLAEVHVNDIARNSSGAMLNVTVWEPSN